MEAFPELTHMGVGMLVGEQPGIAGALDDIAAAGMATMKRLKMA